MTVVISAQYTHGEHRVLKVLNESQQTAEAWVKEHLDNAIEKWPDYRIPLCYKETEVDGDGNAALFGPIIHAVNHAEVQARRNAMFAKRRRSDA